jgi:hypothetical protein
MKIEPRVPLPVQTTLRYRLLPAFDLRPADVQAAFDAHLQRGAIDHVGFCIRCGRREARADALKACPRCPNAWHRSAACSQGGCPDCEFVPVFDTSSRFLHL